MSRRRYMGNVDFRMEPILYQYTGNYQAFIAPVAGLYKIECWGAQGCNGNANSINCFGGYVSGIIQLAKGEVLYIYCGDGGKNNTYTERWNGGGKASPSRASVSEWMWVNQGAGGGATDVRLISGNWDNISSLRSRIIVAAAGGGGTYNGGIHPYGNLSRGGGLVGYENGPTTGSLSNNAKGGTQTSGGKGDTTSFLSGNKGGFGFGADANQTTGADETKGALGCGGGGGYYGGGSGGTQSGYIGTGGGGSSFISGHNGCNAINSSGVHTGNANHYSGKVFTETIMIDGAGYQWTTQKDSLLLMPNPLGGTYPSGQGHKGAGYCIISQAT
ncbi:glycine rich domain-containing protein [Parabacteroides sp. AM08-6]|uniref:glycine rich domain-containing protein n=1 Tax=Parabacteroides sp. AM08-6 TaxID=2292053 RepID=UPI000F00AE67|nr:glycine rich domain-containing protein [Parabacteroides sp. AM08-6]